MGSELPQTATTNDRLPLNLIDKLFPDRAHVELGDSGGPYQAVSLAGGEKQYTLFSQSFFCKGL